MATLSHDSKSYRASGIVVRDARHIHNGPDATYKAPAARKDRRRWCRGKVGVEHKTAVKDDMSLGKHSYSFCNALVRYCTACGKELASWSPPVALRMAGGGTRIIEQPKPDWVIEYLAAQRA